MQRHKQNLKRNLPNMISSKLCLYLGAPISRHWYFPASDGWIFLIVSVVWRPSFETFASSYRSVKFWFSFSPLYKCNSSLECGLHDVHRIKRVLFVLHVNFTVDPVATNALCSLGMMMPCTAINNDCQLISCQNSRRTGPQAYVSSPIFNPTDPNPINHKNENPYKWFRSRWS
jgi:hypothetical protein